MEQKFTQLQAKIGADQSFVEKLFSLETPEEVQRLLKAENMDFTLEEINMFKESLVKAIAKGEGGELSDDELEEVAGGYTPSGVLYFGNISGYRGDNRW
jgi:predicted ribosomally synthesized peptide with nif11-like leader